MSSQLKITGLYDEGNVSPDFLLAWTASIATVRAFIYTGGKSYRGHHSSSLPLILLTTEMRAPNPPASKLTPVYAETLNFRI
jgi:hypothetical protein